MIVWATVRVGTGVAWSDEYGVLVLAKPTARRLPQDGTWLELVRWCLLGEKNGGSRQWSRVVRWLRAERPEVTTVVSYSDPSAGHTGALYKASNWLWCPGNGSWHAGAYQPPKDRWIYVLRPDERRAELLRVRDSRAARQPGAAKPVVPSPPLDARPAQAELAGARRPNPPGDEAGAREHSSLTEAVGE